MSWIFLSFVLQGLVMILVCTLKKSRPGLERYWKTGFSMARFDEQKVNPSINGDSCKWLSQILCSHRFPPIPIVKGPTMILYVNQNHVVNIPCWSWLQSACSRIFFCHSLWGRSLRSSELNRNLRPEAENSANSTIALHGLSRQVLLGCCCHVGSGAHQRWVLSWGWHLTETPGAKMMVVLLRKNIRNIPWVHRIQEEWWFLIDEHDLKPMDFTSSKSDVTKVKLWIYHNLPKAMGIYGDFIIMIWSRNT